MLSLSLKLFLIGLLLNPFLINVIGFISPFWAAFVLDDNMKALDLLHVFQPFAPFASIIFSLSLFKLIKIESRKWIKILCALTVLIYLASSIYGFFPKNEMIFGVVSSIYYAMEVVMLFLAGLILLKKSDVLQESPLPSNIA